MLLKILYIFTRLFDERYSYIRSTKDYIIFLLYLFNVLMLVTHIIVVQTRKVHVPVIQQGKTFSYYQTIQWNLSLNILFTITNEIVHVIVFNYKDNKLSFRPFILLNIYISLYLCNGSLRCVK